MLLTTCKFQKQIVSTKIACMIIEKRLKQWFILKPSNEIIELKTMLLQHMRKHVNYKFQSFKVCCVTLMQKLAGKSKLKSAAVILSAWFTS